MLKILDLFCGAGGCAAGYALACKELGLPFEITGVDINPQKNYPFNFIQGDAIKFFDQNSSEYNFYHASPPCQAYSQACGQYKKKFTYPDLAPVIQKLFMDLYTVSVIENVPGSPLRKDIILAGTMFGLKVLRRRVFQVNNILVMQPGIPAWRKGGVLRGEYASVFGSASRRANRMVKKDLQLPGKRVQDKWAFAMGIDWMTEKELAQAIPPAYTRYLGLQIFPHIH